MLFWANYHQGAEFQSKSGMERRSTPLPASTNVRRARGVFQHDFIFCVGGLWPSFGQAHWRHGGQFLAADVRHAVPGSVRLRIWDRAGGTGVSAVPSERHIGDWSGRRCVVSSVATARITNFHVADSMSDG